jgi:hypothetical protein
MATIEQPEDVNCRRCRRLGVAAVAQLGVITAANGADPFPR